VSKLSGGDGASRERGATAGKGDAVLIHAGTAVAGARAAGKGGPGTAEAREGLTTHRGREVSQCRRYNTSWLLAGPRRRAPGPAPVWQRLLGPAGKLALFRLPSGDGPRRAVRWSHVGRGHYDGLARLHRRMCFDEEDPGTAAGAAVRSSSGRPAIGRPPGRPRSFLFPLTPGACRRAERWHPWSCFLPTDPGLPPATQWPGGPCGRRGHWQGGRAGRPTRGQTYVGLGLGRRGLDRGRGGGRPRARLAYEGLRVPCPPGARPPLRAY